MFDLFCLFFHIFLDNYETSIWIFDKFCFNEKFRKPIFGLQTPIFTFPQNPGNHFPKVNLQERQSGVNTSPWKVDLSFLLLGDRGTPEIHVIQEKREKTKLEFEAQKWASRIFRWSKIDFLNMNIHIPEPKISNVTQKRQKIAKHVFQHVPKYCSKFYI